MPMPSAYQQRSGQGSRKPNVAPTQHRPQPRHFTNYYETVVDIAEDLGEIRFTLISETNLKLHIRITKDGIFKNKNIYPEKPIEAKAFIMKRKGAFDQLLAEFLKKKGVLTKYAPVMRLATLSDEAEYLDSDLVFVVRDLGMQARFTIVPGTGSDNTRYSCAGDPLDLTKARAIFIRYYPDFMLQMKAALEMAQLKRDIRSGEQEAKESKEAKKKLGIKSETKDGKVLISAGSVLDKKKAVQADDEIRLKASAAKEIILGKRKVGYVDK